MSSAVEGAVFLRRRDVIKNFFILLCGVVPLFISYATFYLLQSSINSDAGLGTYSLAADYGAQVFTCCFLPPLVMKKLGCKLTLSLSVIAFLPYYAANLYPRFSTLIPTALLLGVAFGTIWSAFCTFTSTLALSYAKIAGADSEKVLGYFFGIAISSLKGASIVGGIGGYFLMSQSVVHVPPTYCGINYCNDPLKYNMSNTSLFPSSNETFDLPKAAKNAHQQTIIIMCSSFLGISVVGLLIAICFLDDVPVTPQSSRRSLSSTIRLILFSRYQQLLIIPGITLGLLQSFYAAEFSKAFFTCPLGIRNTNLSNIVYGSTMLLGALLYGFLSKLFRRYVLLVAGFTLYYVLFLILLVWKPNNVISMLVVTSVAALAESGMLTQTSALYGMIFQTNKEAAFTNSRLWECIGMTIGFAWSFSLCVYVKIYILIAVLTLGLTCISVIEYRLWKGNKDEL